jgi:hypothetical protein
LVVVGIAPVALALAATVPSTKRRSVKPSYVPAT